MYITAFFTDEGTPQTGLSPTIRIRRITDDVLVVTDAVMNEMADGWYKYDFTGYDEEIEYAIRCDGGSALGGSDRYKYATNENYIEDIDAKLTTEHGAGLWSVTDGTNSIQTQLNNLDARIDRILGLTQENHYIDNTSHDGNGNMTASRVRIYSNAASVGTTNDVIATYNMTATYDGNGRLQTYKMEKV